MKIALHNPLLESPEVIAGMSMSIVGKKLGHDIHTFNYAEDIDKFEPDFVLIAHHSLPKLTRFPTYGYISGSFELYSDPKFFNSWMSWDGYFATSHKILNFINNICYTTGKLPPKGIFYNTAHIVLDSDNKPYKTNIKSLENPSLIYAGMNWDSRYLRLLNSLSDEKYFKLYGPPEYWKHLRIPAYRGKIPFTANGLMDVYRNAGVGLALQSAYYTYDDVISNRIFELNSAGAVVITAQMPFIEKYYGDSLLYFDSFADFGEIHKQIDAHMQWIKQNPKLALEKALNAQKIFQEHLSIEKLLPNVIDYHKGAVVNSGYTNILLENQVPEIGVVIRTEGKSPSLLQKALDCIAKQTYPNLKLVIVTNNLNSNTKLIIDEYAKKFQNELEVIEKSDATKRSTLLWAGLSHIKNKGYTYFAAIDEGQEIFPSHYSCFYNFIIDNNEKYRNSAELIYSIWCSKKTVNHFTFCQIKEHRGIINVALSHDRVKALKATALCSFIAKTDLLDDIILEDPLINTNDDKYLQFLLNRKVNPYFNFRVTALIDDNSNSSFENDQLQYDWLTLRTHFTGQYFANGNLIFDQFITDDITYPDYVNNAHAKLSYLDLRGLNPNLAKYKPQIKKILEPFRPAIILFIAKPLRFVVWILMRIYYLR